jgi:hypothetical protein
LSALQVIFSFEIRYTRAAAFVYFVRNTIGQRVIAYLHTLIPHTRWDHGIIGSLSQGHHRRRRRERRRGRWVERRRRWRWGRMERRRVEIISQTTTTMATQAQVCVLTQLYMSILITINLDDQIVPSTWDIFSTLSLNLRH